MKKFIPYKKLSKKEKKKLNALKRADWGTLSPYTRIETGGKEYKRRPKHRNNECMYT